MKTFKEFVFSTAVNVLVGVVACGVAQAETSTKDQGAQNASALQAAREDLQKCFKDKAPQNYGFSKDLNLILDSKQDTFEIVNITDTCEKAKNEFRAEKPPNETAKNALSSCLKSVPENYAFLRVFKEISETKTEIAPGQQKGDACETEKNNYRAAYIFATEFNNKDKDAKQKELCEKVDRDFREAQAKAQTACSDAGASPGAKAKTSTLVACAKLAKSCGEKSALTPEARADKLLEKSLEESIKKAVQGGTGAGLYGPRNSIGFPTTTTTASQGNPYTGNECRPPKKTLEELQESKKAISENIKTLKNELISDQEKIAKELLQLEQEKTKLVTDERDRIRQGAILTRTKDKKRKEDTNKLKTEEAQKQMELIKIRQQIADADSVRVANKAEFNLDVIRFQCEAAAEKSGLTQTKSLTRNIRIRGVLQTKIESCMRGAILDLTKKDEAAAAQISLLNSMVEATNQQINELQQQQIDLVREAQADLMDSGETDSIKRSENYTQTENLIKKISLANEAQRLKSINTQKAIDTVEKDFAYIDHALQDDGPRREKSPQEASSSMNNYLSAVDKVRTVAKSCSAKGIGIDLFSEDNVKNLASDYELMSKAIRGTK